MKNKLEVGMYVRTKKGIAKIIGQNDDVRYYYPNAYISDTYLGINDDTEYLYEEDIIKTSHNIIDLIEVGDYVNGYKVSFKDNDYKPFVQCDYPVQEGTTNHYRFYEEAIYSIVTKEQMEQMAYKVGD